jgi:FkbM family methyltransferase
MPTLLGRIKDYPNAKAFNYCVSDKEEDVVFNITSNGQSSSILELGTHADIYKSIVVSERIPMRAYTIEQIFKKESLDIRNYQFINIDTQGNELSIIKGIGDAIYYVDAFYLEINEDYLYKKCSLVGEIDDYLMGWKFYRAETKMTNDGWGDALYLKRPTYSSIGRMTPKGWKPE